MQPLLFLFKYYHQLENQLKIHIGKLFKYMSKYGMHRAFGDRLQLGQHMKNWLQDFLLYDRFINLKD